MICSLPAIRRHHYEAFFFLHITFVPLTLIMSALHHPPLSWWCWSALALWVGERTYRFTWWLNTNGFLGGMQSKLPSAKGFRESVYSVEMKPRTLPMHALGQANAVARLPELPCLEATLTGPIHQAVAMANSSYVPPPGFVHAELLPGKTVRVRIVTPGFLSWAPGQHFLINIPAISSFTSHPFTSASVCDSRATDSGRELVFFIRAKKGWTKDLWNTVATLTAAGVKYPRGEKIPAQCGMPERGVLMRGYVDGPFGSAARAKWSDHSTVLLIAGGSGVSFALSVLEYMCMCMAGRDGRELGGHPGGFSKRNFKTQRVRFVWILREFGTPYYIVVSAGRLILTLLTGHVHWCAQALRRCMSLVPSSELQIDIFVTHAQPIMKPIVAPQPIMNSIALKSQDPLLPPAPHFVGEDASYVRSEKFTHSPSSSLGSVDIEEPDEDIVDLSYYTSDIVEEERGELGHDEHILDLTNFEDDDDTALPGEAALNAAVKQEGRARRSFWRRTSYASLHLAKQLGEKRSSSRSSIGKPVIRIIKERPQSKAMLSLGSSISKSQIRSPLATPNSAVPLLTVPEDQVPTFIFPSFSASCTPSQSQAPSPSSSVAYLPTPSRTPSPPHFDPRMSMASSMADSMISEWSDVQSLAALVSKAAAQDQIRLELNEEEMIDISVVAERARAGRPVFNRILADEVEQSKGSVIVGCEHSAVSILLFIR